MLLVDFFFHQAKLKARKKNAGVGKPTPAMDTCGK
jgi:hypothetical protein